MNRAPSRTAFTLLELLIVLAILGLLAALVVPRLGGKVQEAQVKTTIVDINSLSVTLEQFAIDVGRYPTSDEGLAALITRPSGVTEALWKGPYLLKSALPKDGWNNDFIYEVDNGRYIVRSLGADGLPGGDGLDADLDNL